MNGTMDKATSEEANGIGAAACADDGAAELLPPIPPVRKRGLPLWVFRFIRILFRLCPFDAYVAFPLLIFIIICVLGGFIAIVGTDERRLLSWFLMGACGVVLMIIWLTWVAQHPRVPQQDDVLKVPIGDGVDNWPKAPVAPVRGELVTKGSSWFKDSDGRRMLLRGVNMAATAKLPYEPESQRETHLNDGNFTNYKGVSFIGRPFPLEEADLHLGRLRAMGFTFQRFLVTWEAVEHDGPGIYDEAYLEYVRDVVRKCSEHGISVFIDFHQDVWSRWTGGDGAPAWTLEKVGFALDKLDASAAALTQQAWNSEKRYPKMVWNSNNARLAAGTMWTLFFAGNDFAPATVVDGEKIQDWLQGHFIATMAKVAEALKDEPNVVGFDILNEPSVGFVGVKDARDIGPNMYYVGWRVDPWSAMRMGAGETCEVDYFSSFMYIDGKRKLNTQKACAWTNGPTSCVWHANGVWKMDKDNKPRLLKPFYFATNPRTGRPINFIEDYGIRFWLAAAEAIRQEMPDAIIFAEPILDMTDPGKDQRPKLDSHQVGPGYVYAPHYYDGMTLMTHTFSKYIGMDSVTQRPSISMRAIQRSYGKGISKLMHEAQNMGPGGSPVLIGETGIPFDLGGRERKPAIFFSNRRKTKTAFETGDFSECTNALNRTMGAMEHAMVSYTIWCYQQDNTNKYGDGWNGEDLSLFSRDQIIPGDEDNLFAGGRSLVAAIRPYPSRVAGDIIRFSFQPYKRNRRFDLVFRADDSLNTRETVIFLPKYQYPHGAIVKIKAGGGNYKIDWDLQTLTYTHEEYYTHWEFGSHLVHHIVVKKVLASRETVDRSLLEST